MKMEFKKMIEIISKLKCLGDSLGIIVPQPIVKEERLKEGDGVMILFNKRKKNSNPNHHHLLP